MRITRMRGRENAKGERETERRFLSDDQFLFMVRTEKGLKVKFSMEQQQQQPTQAAVLVDVLLLQRNSVIFLCDLFCLHICRHILVD